MKYYFIYKCICEILRCQRISSIHGSQIAADGSCNEYVPYVIQGEAMHERTQFFEDYKEGAKRTTFGRTITEADIVTHAGQSGDFFPHHVDEQWCRDNGLGQRIAHGTLIFAVGVGLTAEEINPAAMSYGYDRLRFVRPVYIGDTIRTAVTITSCKEHKRPGYGIVTEALEITNQRGEVVMVCDHLLLVEKKTEAS